VIRRLISYIFCFLLFSIRVEAQDTITLSFNEYYNQVIANHPITKQARLLPQQARMELRSARGNFDPAIDIDLQNKTTNDKNSYTYFMPQVKVPTRIGVDLKGGYEGSSGTNVNPEVGKFNPSAGSYYNYGLWYGGVSVPIGQGLLFDQRRAALQQAQLLQTLAEAEQIKIINKVLLTTAKDYWDWQQAYEKVKLMRSNIQVAQDRIDFINRRIRLGEEKPIDSVEAMIEFRRREVLLLEAEVEFKNAGLILSNHLWNEKNEPLQLAFNVIPESYDNNISIASPDSLFTLINLARENHPEIIKLNTKIKSLEVERKLAAELLKPRLSVDYYPFQTFTNGSRDEVPNIFQNNYKAGASFYMPLLLRKERGKLQVTKFKLRQSEFELMQERREILNDITISYNELRNLQQLLEIQLGLVNNSITLRDAEEMRFESGESSLFLVNQRERSLIEAQAKLVELHAKFSKAKIQLQWSAGVRMY
jgi:outer membrane protein TolC